MGFPHLKRSDGELLHCHDRPRRCPLVSKVPKAKTLGNSSHKVGMAKGLRRRALEDQKYNKAKLI
jgi:hypothetical protein